MAPLTKTTFEFFQYNSRDWYKIIIYFNLLTKLKKNNNNNNEIEIKITIMIKY